MLVEQEIVQMSFLWYPFNHWHLHNTDIQVWSVLCNTFSRNLIQSYLLLIVLIWSSWLLQPCSCWILFLRSAVYVLLGLYPAIQFCLVVLVWT